MQILRKLSLGLMALGLVSPVVALAGDPEPGSKPVITTPISLKEPVCQKCESGEGHGLFHRIRHQHTHEHGQAPHVCAHCMKKIEEAGPPSGMILAGKPGDSLMCPSCQAAMNESSTPLILSSGPVTVTEGAVVMEGSDPGVTLVENSAPGHAVVGEVAPGTDPEPIGETRVAYGATGAAGAASSVAMNSPSSAPGYASVNDVSHAKKSRRKAKNPPTEMRESALRDTSRSWAHIFLPRTGAIGARSKELARQDHAKVRYDNDVQQVSDLPSKMVYGR